VKLGVLELGFWAFLVIGIGRLPELIGLAFLPLGKIALALPLFIRIRRWKQLPRLGMAARPLARTAAWMVVLAVLTTPTSIWPGRSLIFLEQEVPVLLASVSIAYVMSRSWKALRGTLLALILSGLVLARSTISGYGGGRASTGTMLDPNDLAYLLVTLFPLIVGFVITSGTKLWRAIYVGIGAIFLIALLLTQSRGGLLGLVSIVIFLVLVPIRAPDKTLASGSTQGKNRLALFLGVACLSVVVWSQLPEDARHRFSTILDLSHDYNLDPENVTARGQLWTRAMQAITSWPLGWGPQTFGMVDWKLGGRFFAPHNSYLEAGVELGVLGLFLYLRMYVLAWRGLQRARTALISPESPSRDHQEAAAFARLLQICLVGNAVAGFFLSMAYALVLWTIFGICMAVMAFAEQQPTST
jgi:O-antigen ligase